MFRYWVMVKGCEGKPDVKASDHAFEKDACEKAEYFVRERDYYEASVVDRIHMTTIFRITRTIVVWRPQVAKSEIVSAEPIEQLRKELLDSDNIWTAIEVLTNRLGREVGMHLETLLCRENQNHPPV